MVKFKEDTSIVNNFYKLFIYLFIFLTHKKDTEKENSLKTDTLSNTTMEGTTSMTPPPGGRALYTRSEAQALGLRVLSSRNSPSFSSFTTINSIYSYMHLCIYVCYLFSFSKIKQPSH